MFTYQEFQHIQRFCPFLVEAQQLDPNLTGGHVLKEKALLMHGMTNRQLFHTDTDTQSRLQQTARLMCLCHVPLICTGRRVIKKPDKVTFCCLLKQMSLSDHFLCFTFSDMVLIWTLIVLPSLCVYVWYLLCCSQFTMCMFPSIPAFFLVFLDIVFCLHPFGFSYICGLTPLF